MHPKDEDAYPPGTVVSLKKTGEFAVIKKVVFQFNEKGFLHYLCHIDGRENSETSFWALYQNDIILEHLPPKEEPKQ